MARVVTKDVEIGGCPMKVGDKVLMPFPAANRYPAVFDSPDEVNITGSPLHHIAGFSGPHSGLLLGHTSVILDHFDAAEWFATVARERATAVPCHRKPGSNQSHLSVLRWNGSNHRPEA